MTVSNADILQAVERLGHQIATVNQNVLAVGNQGAATHALVRALHSLNEQQLAIALDGLDENTVQRLHAVIELAHQRADDEAVLRRTAADLGRMTDRETDQ